MKLIDIHLFHYVRPSGGQLNFDHIQLCSDIKSAMHSANITDYERVERAETAIAECVAVFEGNSNEAVAFNFMVLGQLLGWLQKDSNRLTPEMMELTLKATKYYYNQRTLIDNNNRPAQIVKSIGIKLANKFWDSNSNARTGDAVKYVMDGVRSQIEDMPWREDMSAKGLQVDKLKAPKEGTVRNWLKQSNKPESAKKGGAPKTPEKK
jgi:hypothetical protein